MTLFKIDKKFYFLHTTYEQLMSEAWQYIHLSGKYSGYYLKGGTPTHQNQYVFFCHNLEKIKLKQVEEEYYKLMDPHHANTNTPKKAQDSSENSETSTIASNLQDSVVLARHIKNGSVNLLAIEGAENAFVGTVLTRGINGLSWQMNPHHKTSNVTIVLSIM
jgi:hypothetical protein